MRYFIILVLCLALNFSSDFLYAQTKAGFRVTANIKGLKDGSGVLMLIKRYGKIDTVARASAKNETFVFNNVRLPYYPDFYLIAIQNEFVENLRLFLDQEEDVKINGDLAKWPDVKITGSKTHEDFSLWVKLVYASWPEFDSLKVHNGTPEEFEKNNFRPRMQFIEQRPGSPVIAYFLSNWKGHDGKPVDAEMKRPIYEKLPQAVKDSFYGKAVARQLASADYMKSLKEYAGDGALPASISGETAGRRLRETSGRKVSMTGSAVSVDALSDDQLAEKLKASTLIVNMGYRVPGTHQMQVNPTTAYVIDESGICVTNYHVFKEYSGKAMYKNLSVMTAGQVSYQVRDVLSCSEADDLVIFQIDTRGEKLPSIPLGAVAETGKEIAVMGHPIPSFYSFTRGLVTKTTTATLFGAPCKVMHISADFNVGSSGGPIADQCGNVVGTVSRIDGGVKIGIPVSELRKLIEVK